MKTILAPVDFSPISAAVVREATKLAQAVDGRLILLAVVQSPIVLNEYAAMLDLSEITAAAETNAARQLGRFQNELGQLVETETVQLTGAPVPAILDEARKREADYIVMGSHGHTAFYDLLVGSTTHGVMARATCPVVVVPAAKTASPVRQGVQQVSTT